jgi:hypothetical protein
MPAADLNAFQAQQVPQHPGSGKRVVEVEFVDPPHQRQILNDAVRSSPHPTALKSSGRVKAGNTMPLAKW